MAGTDETTTTQQEQETTTDETTTAQQEQQGDGDGELTDKHGEQAINRGRYDRDIKAKDDEIAELKKKLADASKRAEDGEDALKKVEALERRIEDEKLSHSLQVAGCVDEKAAKARLSDFDGDVDKLKESCPYLFAAKQAGSTGARHAGTPSPSDELGRMAREAAGTTYLYKN